MKIILDEMLPPQLKLILADHQVFRVQELNWDGIKNGELLKRANSEFDVFITADKNLPFQQNLKRFSLAIIVLPSNRVEIINDLAGQIRAVLETAPKNVLIEL